MNGKLHEVSTGLGICISRQCEWILSWVNLFDLPNCPHFMLIKLRLRKVTQLGSGKQKVTELRFGSRSLDSKHSPAPSSYFTLLPPFLSGHHTFVFNTRSQHKLTVSPEKSKRTSHIPFLPLATLPTLPQNKRNSKINTFFTEKSFLCIGITPSSCLHCT